MTKLLAQHGVAKGKKISTAMLQGYIDGVIFAPREEKISSIQEYTLKQEELNKDNIFIDAQMYYSTFEGKIFKHLEDNESYPTSVSRKDWRKKTPRFINYLDNHAEVSASMSNNLIVPGFYIQDLDWKFDYTLDIYEYCVQKYHFEKNYLTLLISFDFFHSKTDVDEMLEDIVDNIDNKQGIYFTLCYGKTQEKNYEYVDSQNLANILYFVYALKKAGFEMMIGYTFLNAVLFAMLGCEYVASGWFNNLRRFGKERFDEVDSMGIRKKRYTSMPLFSYITFDNLNNIKEAIDISRLMSACDIDEEVLLNQDAVSFVDLEQQYWQALKQFIEKINKHSSIAEKIEYMLSEINSAKALYNEILENLSDSREEYSRIKTQAKHLDVWSMGIETLKNRISLV